MKKTLVIVSSILVGAVGAYAQGSLNWQDGQNNYDISIYSPSTSNPLAETAGDSAFDIPQGNTTYSGGFIGGTTSPGTGVGATPASGYLGINYQNAAGFTMGLYVDTSLSALTTDITKGTPAATTSLLSGNNAGLYNNIAPTYVSGLAPGTTVFIGLAAWYSGSGATSYATAVTDSTVEGFVESTSAIPLGGGASAPAGLTGVPGLTSFSLAGSTPEPSTIALGVVGASAFLMRLRRKQ
jgi:hypothetical protein